MNFDKLRKGDMLITTDTIKLTNTCDDYVKKGTKLEVVGKLSNGNIGVKEDVFSPSGKVTMYVITKDDIDKVKLVSKYDVGDVLEFPHSMRLTVYRNEKAKGSINITFQKGNQIAIRSIVPQYYNCTVISGEYKGEHITIVQDLADYFLEKLGNTIDGDFGDDKKRGENYMNKPIGFKYGDLVNYYKSVCADDKKPSLALNTNLMFISYLDTPIPYHKDHSIPLDCVCSTLDTHETVLAHSASLKAVKTNHCLNKHEITVKVKGNRVKYMDKVGNNEYVGVAVCDNEDVFNLRTGLLLAISRAYGDKALGDFALDRFKD